jgi:hypothetical protein
VDRAKTGKEEKGMEGMEGMEEGHCAFVRSNSRMLESFPVMVIKERMRKRG